MWLNLRLALRNLRKYRFFSVINLAGLGVGLTVFMFSVIFVRYETNHDHMFAKRDHIVTVGSQFSATSGEPISQYPNIRMAYGPLFQAEVPGILRVVRSKFERRKVHSPTGAFHLGLRFVDDGFTELFDFHYLYGGAAELTKPFTVALSASGARTLFGTPNAVGLILQLDQRWPLRVVAVFDDVGADSHFNSSLMPDVELTSFTSLSTLVATSEYSMAGEWTSLEPTDLTYLLLPDNADLVALQHGVNAVAARHASAEERAYISALNIRPLRYHHTQVWDSLGFPVNETLTLMGLLVLLAAALNYANLASLQHASRAREWGLRKTFGAKPHQLLRQLLLETVVLVAVATWLAFTLVEIIVPLFNAWSAKSVVIDYVQLVPELIVLVALLGLVAGIYPAVQAANYSASDALRKGLADSTLLDRGRAPRLRQLLVAAQFTIATYILALVAVIVLQNNFLQKISDVFGRERILILSEMTAPRLQEHLPEKLLAFQRALHKLPGVQGSVGAESVPYYRIGGASFLPGTEEELLFGEVDTNFFTHYHIPFLHKATDSLAPIDVDYVPVVINDMAMDVLGLDDIDDALGYRYQAETNGVLRNFQVLGVIPTQYFLGVHMRKRPIAFAVKARPYAYWSIKYNAPIDEADVKNVQLLWRQYFPDHPISLQPLDHYFNRFFKIPTMIGKVISLFAGIAALLAIIGLLGLAVFAARQREKELGLRKVFGAGWADLFWLLARQFALPVLSSLCIALPLAYISSQLYLNFFPEQMPFLGLVTLLAGCVSISIAAIVVACQALIVANSSAAHSLQKV